MWKSSGRLDYRQHDHELEMGKRENRNDADLKSLDRQMPPLPRLDDGHPVPLLPLPEKPRRGSSSKQDGMTASTAERNIVPNHQIGILLGC